jgi:hypothetical protein
MAVSFRDLLDAFETVGFSSGFGENAAYLCRETDKILLQFASDEDSEELPEDIEDEDKYIPIPDKRELDLGKPLVLAFAREFLPGLPPDGSSVMKAPSTALRAVPLPRSATLRFAGEDESGVPRIASQFR